MFELGLTMARSVCAEMGVSLELVQSGLKTRNIAAVRQRIVDRLRAETNLSWREIGIIVGRAKGFRGARRGVK